MTVRYWCFSPEQLEAALKAWAASGELHDPEPRPFNASEARMCVALVRLFLTSEAAIAHGLLIEHEIALPPAPEPFRHMPRVAPPATGTERP